jgi:hypothetical protein
MARAKSRLSRKKAIANPGQSASTSVPSPSFKTIILGYLRHLSTLFFGMFFSALSFFILTRIEPSAVQHLILPNTYLPFLASIFLTIFFLTSFFLLNSRRGFLLATAVTILLFFRLQQILIESAIFFIIAAPLLLIEVAFSLINRTT